MFNRDRVCLRFVFRRLKLCVRVCVCDHVCYHADVRDDSREPLGTRPRPIYPRRHAAGAICELATIPGYYPQHQYPRVWLQYCVEGEIGGILDTSYVLRTIFLMTELVRVCCFQFSRSKRGMIMKRCGPGETPGVHSMLRSLFL